MISSLVALALALALAPTWPAPDAPPPDAVAASHAFAAAR